MALNGFIGVNFNPARLGPDTRGAPQQPPEFSDIDRRN
jgi:hypothetical protein